MSNASLQYIPSAMFSGRNNLRRLHLGSHPLLPALPPVRNLPNLQLVVLAMLYDVRAVEMANLPSLVSLSLVDMRRLATLPALEQFPNAHVLLLHANAFCCNGYLSDHSCDPTTVAMCQDLFAKYELSCRPSDAARSSAATLALVQSDAINCYDMIGSIDFYDLAPTRAEVDACAGKMYSQCEYYGGVPGLCAFSHFEPLRCVETSEGFAAMRRAEIQLGLGDKCNAANEAWLGCAS